MSATVTISQELYDELREDSRWLDCLKWAGVDNWDGYDYAAELYREKYGDEGEAND